jgi:antitoxin YobK
MFIKLSLRVSIPKLKLGNEIIVKQSTLIQIQHLLVLIVESSTSGVQITGSQELTIFSVQIIMSLQDLQSAFDLIAEYGGGDFEGEKEASLIEEAEKALGIAFPPTYKKFLAKFGCGDIEGLEIYGLISDDFENSSVPDAVWLTLDERKSGLPDHLILVYATGDGGYYALDTSQANEDGECPVVAYELNGQVEKVADDYGSFLLSELRTVLS